MPQHNKKYAQREKFYMAGKIYPDLRVGMIKVNLTPTVTVDADGKRHIEPNAPVYIYDTSGPFSDPDVKTDLRKGIERIRQPWIDSRRTSGHGTTQMACCQGTDRKSVV